MFIPGFMATPRAYESLLAPLRRAQVRLTVTDRPRWESLSGRYSPAEEAADVLRRADAQAGTERLWLAGHSRGGQVAWRVAQLDPDRIAGLFLVDPVDGAGRDGGGPRAAAEPVRFACPTTIVGAGRGGRCAPGPVNHQTFADALPTAAHVVLPELGHADVLDGWERAVGRWLCGGGAPDPDVARDHVAGLLLDAGTSPRACS